MYRMNEIMLKAFMVMVISFGLLGRTYKIQAAEPQSYLQPFVAQVIASLAPDMNPNELINGVQASYGVNPSTLEPPTPGYFPGFGFPGMIPSLYGGLGALGPGYPGFGHLSPYSHLGYSPGFGFAGPGMPPMYGGFAGAGPGMPPMYGGFAGAGTGMLSMYGGSAGFAGTGMLSMYGGSAGFAGAGMLPMYGGLAGFAGAGIYPPMYGGSPLANILQPGHYLVGGIEANHLGTEYGIIMPPTSTAEGVTPTDIQYHGQLGVPIPEYNITLDLPGYDGEITNSLYFNPFTGEIYPVWSMPWWWSEQESDTEN